MKSFWLIFPLLCAVGVLPAQITRKGFVFGAAAGASALTLHSDGAGTNRQVAGSFPNFKLGYMVSPRTAAVLLLPGTVYSWQWEGRTRDRGFEAIVPSVQYWPKPRWWLMAGAGLGMDAPAFYDIKNPDERKFYFGWAGIAGTGYEIWQKNRFALDVQLRMHTGNINLPTGPQRGLAWTLGIGFNWY